jgi:DNA-binding response OmpR family regulator
VLIVDDDPQIRDLLAAAVREWGWDGTAAATLAEARALLDRATPDLLILDSQLPDGSAVDLVHQTRRHPALRLPILMYTGLGAEEAQLALKAGADDYLVKPAPLEVIERKARALVGAPLDAADAAAETDDRLLTKQPIAEGSTP